MLRAQVGGHDGGDTGGDVYGGAALQLLGRDHLQQVELDPGPAQALCVGEDVLGAVQGADLDGNVSLLGDLEDAFLTRSGA